MVQALLLLLGILATSTSILFIKASHVDPALLSGLRLLVAAAILSPLYLRARRAHPDAIGPKRWGPPALALALHFLTWTIGARMTLAANASLIVNMVPLATPFFLALLAEERITKTELAGTALGIAGVLTLSISDIRAGHAGGDAVCFSSMLLYALYLTLGRRNRDIASVWLYLIPLYATAGVFCLLVGLPRISSLSGLPGREWLLILGLGLVPTVVGHSLTNLSMRHFRGSTVSVCCLGQFVFAALGAWWIFGEQPKELFWPAAALVTLGAVLVLSPKPKAA